MTTDDHNPMVTLSPPSEFLAPCPKFRILVLGNPESTKQELFSRIFGVDLEKKLVSDTFEPNHNINNELFLEGQNERLAIHASPNFSSGDENIYHTVCDFLTERSSSPNLADHVHVIWYCVASQQTREISSLEKKFFRGDWITVAHAHHIPIILTFTKYDEFVSQVMMDWLRNSSGDSGLSKVAVGHILRDLSTKKFEKTIGSKWDSLLDKVIQRVCVSSGDSDDDLRSFEALAEKTLASLRDHEVKVAFAAAQRNSAYISTEYAAETAAESYFETDTGHARKIHGVDMRDILPNFYAKAVQLFNMKDIPATLDNSSLLSKVLDATFGTHQKPLLAESLRRSGTESGSILLHLSPHERAVLLTQALAGIILFLHMLADAQWPEGHEGPTSATVTLTEKTISRELEDLRLGGGKKDLLEIVETSHIFTECQLKQDIAALLVKAVTQAEKTELSKTAPNNYRHNKGFTRAVVVEDDSELQEISLSFVNDHGPDDIVLPCGLTILPLN
ncbi:hypothetical protein QBC35DRAFT_464069 [Podospora australis]|uniref:G domain-containing protein n=1 Tax=Podospora australis TaxID=1536484 RepID=A0AAN6WTD1_9PEZI|nr:hypothetical protein QBC35DRAFT_464069 [Podospora australis]